MQKSLIIKINKHNHSRDQRTIEQRTEWQASNIHPCRTRPDKEHKKHWGLNTQGVIGKQDTPGNNQRTNQQEKLQRTKEHGIKQEISKVHTRSGVHKTGIMTEPTPPDLDAPWSASVPPPSWTFMTVGSVWKLLLRGGGALSHVLCVCPWTFKFTCFLCFML